MQNLNTTNAINEMLQMQSNLNNATNGPDWRSGVTELGRTINWQRCIYMEAAELIESYPWKHWKSVDAEIDEENARVELVDICHFLISFALEKFESEKAAMLLEKALSSHQKTKVLSIVKIDVMQQVAVHETLMKIALESAGNSVAETEVYFMRLAESFFKACQVVELDFVQLYKIYMAKNVLNKFRQDNGYKEGSYIKEWNGKEDNVVMFEIIRGLKEFYGKDLYDLLEKEYQQHKL